MKNNHNNFSSDLLNTPQCKKIMDKKNDIEKLANSSDGQKVREILNGSGDLMSAAKNGDMATLQNTLKNILNTEEGTRLAKKISDMMN